MKLNKHDLTHAVLCKPPGQNFFEVIAAFNCGEAASAYAAQCNAAHNVNWAYKVEKITHE